MFKEKIIIEMKEVFKEIPFGIGPHAAQVRDVMDIPFGKGDHLFHDLCNGHHLFHSRF